MPPLSLITPFRTDYYNNYARIFEQRGDLRKCFLWTRNGYPGIPKQKHELIPALGMAAYAGAKILPPFAAESFRFSLHPLFDSWAQRRLHPGENVLSSYGYANKCFRYAQQTGGKTFLDAGNSHPLNFWEILTEEHRIWKCKITPISKSQHLRSIRMMDHVDYVISPSHFVTNSFLNQGFPPKNIIRSFFPIDLDLFFPSDQPRPQDRPFTIVNTGGLSLRKGTPYLLEAFRIILHKIPNARFLLTSAITDSIKPILEKYNDLPIDWAPYLSERDLADRLRGSDLFILPSLEEGLVRTALQAMSCGLPVILTPNTGANDYVEPETNGSIVPIRNSQAIADSAIQWWERIRSGYRVTNEDLNNQLSYSQLFETINKQLEDLEL